MASGRVSTNNFSVANFIVDINGIQNGATHSSISDAVSDASGATVIYVRPGTYVEDITLGAQIILCAFPGGGNVTLNGKISQTTGTSYLFGMRFVTNSDYVYDVSGTGTIQTIFRDCEFFTTDNVAIRINNSNASSQFVNCQFQITNTHGMFNITSCNSVNFYKCQKSQTSGSGASTIAAGTLLIKNSYITAESFTSSSTGVIEAFHSDFRNDTSNIVPITTAGSGTNIIQHCYLRSGTSASISAGSGTTINVSECTVHSSNSNPITGAGTIVLGSISYTNTGTGINASNITDRGMLTGKLTFDGTNFMDTYQEGTFNPTVIGTSTAGTASYSVQIGNYTRTGREVNFRIALVWTGGTGTGNLQITGLPFTVNANNGNCAVAMNFSSTLAVTAGYDQVNAFVGANSTNINFTEIDFNTASGSLAYDAGASITLSGCYYV